ncbi:ATP-binding cassette domain-containing protein [Shimia sp. Alg240-R146]|uniref:ATP-binding cassette domain-containing protein n=1 Tax=Shimia sp. Alg240-R146 TaxID=2993449 RepID=UPI0022E45ED1|nr:ATP-binding cassette domain-containing protein [Shimia sp. Alg240-R146]
MDSFAAFARQTAKSDPELEGRASSVTLLPAEDSESGEDPETGLYVSQLSARTSDGKALLTSVSFSIEPGSLVGITGDSFAGKSTLMRAILAPHDLAALHITGRVVLNGTNLWDRSGREQEFSAVHIPPQPSVVPGGGNDNLTCFGDASRQERARRILKSLVFTTDTVDHITHTQDVTQLSAGEQKAMSFARALALRPRLYLFDRPEDGASEKLIGALGNRVLADTKLGGIGIFVTDSRQLLDMCDKILVMQNGRLIEYAESSEIRARQSTGWNKFVTERELESEEALDAWLSSHFRRDGDEANRRAICMIANEMLSVACTMASKRDADLDKISFGFKHFSGHCLLTLTDPSLSLSSGAMSKARAAAKTSVQGERLSPLAKIIRDALEVEASNDDEAGTLQVSVKTYDPRKQTQSKASKDDTTVH